jgi:hypothetical protein
VPGLSTRLLDSSGNPIGSATTTPASDDRGLVVRSVLESRLPGALISGRLDANVGSWLGSTLPTVGQKNSASSLPVVLAFDHSTVAVDTAKVFGRPEPPTYYARFDAITVAPGKCMACLWNASTSHVVRVWRIWAFQDAEGAVTGGMTRQELWKIIGRTGAGTLVNPLALDDADTLTSGIQASHNATGVTEQANGLIRRGYVTTEEAKLAPAQALSSDTLGAFDWAGVDTHLFWHAGAHGRCKPIVLRKDKGLVMKNITGNGGSVSYVFEFTDEAS